jgi:hypothetical protein
MFNMQTVGLLGFLGLPGMIALWRPVPMLRPGGMIRLLGLLVLIGFAGFWYPLAGALGACGAFGLWNHPSPALHRLAWLGLASPLAICLDTYLLVTRGS